MAFDGTADLSDLGRALAGLALLLFLWSLFRFSMGLRYAKRAREEARRAEESRGRRVVAEIPTDDGVVFFLEDTNGFYWGDASLGKSDVAGGRLVLNGAVLASFSRNGADLPAPPASEEYEGRERWEVVLYLRDGSTRSVPCGSLREGVSRDVARSVFEAVAARFGGKGAEGS